ncbi:MAG: outer membrane beta-barrel protein [Janthinobacterium lividum]
MHYHIGFSHSVRAFASLLLLSASGLAHGQATPAPTAATPGFYAGFRAGYSSYTMDGQEVNLHTRSGGNLQRAQWLTLGAILRQRLYKPLSVQAELVYVREGGTLQGGGFLGKTVYTIDCLQLPLLLNLRIPSDERLALHLEGGLALTAVLSGVELDLPNFAPQNNFTNPSSFYSQVYGAELAWQQGKRLYFFNARYTADFTDYFQREYLGTHYNARSSGLSLTVGVLFGH